MKRKLLKIFSVLMLMFFIFSSVETVYASEVPAGLGNKTHPLIITPDPSILVNHAVVPIPDSTVIPVHIYLKMSDPEGLDNYVKSVSDPKSPNYHHFLTPDQLNAMFGPPDSAVTSVNSYFTSFGLTRDKADKLKSHLEYTGTVGTIAKLFKTQIKQVKIDAKVMPTATMAINVPAEVSSYIETITGLTPHEIKHPDSSSTHNLIKIPISSDAVIPNSTSGDSLTITSDSRFQNGLSAPTGQNIYLRIIAKDQSGNYITNARLSVSLLGGNIPASALWASSFEPNNTDSNGEMDLYIKAYQAGTENFSFSIPDSSGGTATNSISLTWTGPNIVQTAFTPNQINTAYDATNIVNNLSGHNASVGIYGDTMPDPNVLAAFENKYGLPAANFIPVPVDQTGNSPDSGAVEEADLDIQRVESSAPGATIYFYADYGDMLDGLTAAVQEDRVSVYSISYGFIGPLPTDYENAWETQLEAAAAEGITVVASSGDNGAYENLGSTNPMASPFAQMPSASPYVLSVGGTQLAINSNTNETASEWGWSWDNNWNGYPNASGGGFSTDFPVPAWQNGIVSSSATGRGVPDLSFAATSPGYDTYLSDPPQDNAMVGTSASAPTLAGWIAAYNAEQNTRLGLLNPNLYKLYQGNFSVFHDITVGYNGCYNAGTGWDAVTGLGSLDVDAFFNALTPYYTSLPAKGSLDTNISGTLSGTVNLWGWYLDGSGVSTVQVLIDNSPVGTASYGDSRTDVAAALPAYNNSNSGYHYSLDTTKLTNGKHTLVIQETGKNGKQASLPGVNINVSNVSALPALG
ncbi:S53 family peptidase, partial [Desulfosporosinus acididurans]|uniref:S53 family peptidase n=1 Tax=Desulfosporosinus acididurans TaxID=476652 RepID=UPI000A4A2EE8